MDHGLKLEARDHRNQHGWLLGWNSSDDPLGCLSLEKVRIGWDCRREALRRRESDRGAPDHNRSGSDLFAPGFRQGAGRPIYGEVLNLGRVDFVGLRSRPWRQPSWTPSFRPDLLANLIGTDRRDPVPVAQAREPFHLVLAIRQGRDDIALGIVATIPKDNQVPVLIDECGGGFSVIPSSAFLKVQWAGV